MSALDATIRLDRGGFVVDLALHLPPGTTVALLGPNGAGKSTVVAALAGLVAVDDGRITLGDRVLLDTARRVDLAPQRRRVGVVFQSGLLFPHLSVGENVGFGADVADAEEWIERLDLGGLVGRKPGEISGGEARRVALARTLAAKPDVLLLDEPFAGVDGAAMRDLRILLDQHLEAFPGPRLIVTHDPVDMHHLADEVRVMEAGRITMVGTPDDLTLRPNTRWAADLAGANFYTGVAEGGLVTIGGHRLSIADRSVVGPVTVVIHPRVVSLHSTHPEGSARNVWLAPVVAAEPLGDRVRVRLGGPLPVVAEVTVAGARAIDLTGDVWASVKATEVAVLPA